MELLPRNVEMYISKPFEFRNEQELNKFLKRASYESLDSLFVKVESFARKYIVGSDTHITMVSADSLLTYFQDKLGQVHYLFFYGDNDTGKSANLTFMAQIAYRAMFDIDITPANIYTYLGSIQEGQGCILEDEADNIDKNEEKMKIYKRGYNAGGTVTRQDDERIQDAYFVYCFKAFTAERRPDNDKAKGFNERNLYIECQSGTPEYDIVEVTSGAAGEPIFQARLEELQELRKLLFAYRLLHHSDPLPDIKNLSVRNREKQLTKPLLRLFQGCACRQQIAKALAELIAKSRGVKKDTLDAKIYAVIKEMIDENQGQLYKFTNTLVFTNVCEALGGKYKNEGDQSFDTPEHGFVSHKRITQICTDKFGATKEHIKNIRHLSFDKDKLAKASEAYELADTLELLLSEGEESYRTLGDTSYTSYTCTDSEGVPAHDPNTENHTQESKNSLNVNENMEKIDEIDSSKGADHSENILPTS